MRKQNPFLTVGQLAKRWKMTTPTLRQWRWFNKGPQFQKIGGRALYKLEEIERFENELIRAHTADGGQNPLENIEQLISKKIESDNR
jgi:hypothetical protein